MITEKEFLDAVEIVRKYKTQLTQLFNEVENTQKIVNAKRFVNIKKNDWIRITKSSGDSKYIIVGEKFRVKNSRLRSDYHSKLFDNFINDKHGKDFEYDFNNFDMFQNDLIESKTKYKQLVVINLPHNNSSYTLSSDNYDYEVL